MKAECQCRRIVVRPDIHALHILHVWALCKCGREVRWRRENGVLVHVWSEVRYGKHRKPNL